MFLKIFHIFMIEYCHFTNLQKDFTNIVHVYYENFHVIPRPVLYI